LRPLRIVVCLKPVPDPKRWAEISLDPVTKTLRRDRIPFVLDPLGLSALEEGLRVRDAHGGQVTVVCMAPPTATSVLTEALCIGADSAVLLSDRAFAGADTLATSYVLSMGIRKLGDCDLIFCGNRSADGSTGQVGPQLAEFLDIPSVSRVIELTVLDEGVRVRARLDEGRQIVEAPFPCLLTVEKEINTPRLKSVMGILKARSKPTSTWGAGDLGADPERIGVPGSPTRVSEVFTVEAKRRAEMITAPPAQAAEALIEALRRLGALAGSK
jgi:electron transfer flavoprotein beta subunit